MSFTRESCYSGRLANQIFRNLAVSFIAKKNNLYVEYSSHDLIKSLGIDLFIGENKYIHTQNLTDDNYFNILDKDKIDYNIDSNYNFFQTKEISYFLYNYLHSENIKQNIMSMNIFNERYNNNNDIFIHIRLTDACNFNPGLEYYLNTIKEIKNTECNIYIASDDINHQIIKDILCEYPNSVVLNYNEKETIQFGSTCKNLILSQGTFSSMIGYLGFFSTIYYPKIKTIWHGDVFSIEGWKEVYW